MIGTRTLETAMILAAGYGKRMRPITDKVPKPLVKLNGITLIDRVVTHLRRAGIKQIVINAHHLAEKLEAHFSGYPDIELVYEVELLETGGGIRNALPLLGDGPFFVVNSDAVWFDGPYPALHRMAEMWRDEKMDVLLLMQRTTNILAETGLGDFFLTPDGKARRRQGSAVSPFLYAGVQILSPVTFEHAPPGAFSINVLYDKAEEAGRLYGIVHDGAWYHVGTPDQLRLAENEIADGGISVNLR